MKRTMHRTGLHAYSKVEVDPATDSNEEAHELLTLVAGTNAARLARIEQRAAVYADVSGVATELETIRDIVNTGRDRELSLGLLALERGLDLLDTGRHLNGVLRDQQRQAGTRKERRPDITLWIDKQLERNPAAKTPAMWASAPEWITDQIGQRSFATRVTKRRMARK